MDFLALFVTLPAGQSAGRMRIWRALRGLGCATLRDGVYLLPESAANAAALTRVAEEARGVQGTAELFLLPGRDDAQRRQVVSLFDRGADYARLLVAIKAATGSDARTVRTLRREFTTLAAIDFFPGEARRQAEEALATLEAAATGEPVRASGAIRRLDASEYRQRTWATRRHLWVDRMASAWLIRRFIDRKAEFLWLDDPKRCPKRALGFDFDGAPFTHQDGRVTFEVLAASFGLEADPALARMGALVHFLDVGGVPVAEAPGIEAVLAGFRESAADDDRLFSEASRLFDGLYRNFSQEQTHE